MQLKRAAKTCGVSMQDAARAAIREWVVRVDHTSKVDEAAGLIMGVHADALRRLGE